MIQDMNKEIADFVKIMVQGAKTNIKKSGNLTPVFFIMENIGNINALVPDFSSTEAKLASIEAVKKLARERKAKAVLSIVESWQRKMDEKEYSYHKAEKLAISDYPDREEVVMFILEVPEGTFMANPKIIRNGKEVDFEDPVFTKHENVVGNMIGLVPGKK